MTETKTDKTPDPVAEETPEETPEEAPKRKTVLLGGAAETQIPESDLIVNPDFPVPQEILDLLPEQFGPTSFFVKAATIGEDGVPIDYEILEDRLKGLTFDRVVGRPLQKKKRLKVMKAMKPDGTLIQIPWERRLNNAAAGTDAAQIGLITYTDKGFILLQDEQKYPYYCFAIDCWAAAMRTVLLKVYPMEEEAIGSGYCSSVHSVHTNPNKSAGIFGEGATTSQTWNV